MRHTRSFSVVRPLRGAMSVKTVAFIAGGLLVVVIGGYVMLSRSPEDLLNAQELSPKEIRIVATRLLMHDDVKIRARASDKLTSQGAAAVPVLKEIGLQNSSMPLRLAVFGVLTGMDKDAAAEILENMICDPDPKMRRQAVSAAVQLNTPRGVAVLEKALTDQDGTVRSVAAGSMGPAGARSAAPALIAALKDPEFAVRSHAARSLQQLTGRDYSDQIAPPQN